MNFKIVFLSLLLFSCTQSLNIKKNKIDTTDIPFISKGFALVYSDDLYDNKIISKKMDERSLIVFQKNLPKNTDIKIINLLNNKTIIARVGDNSNYPGFFNSVLSKRIAIDLDINIDEPYIEIVEINNNTTFVANKAKMFEEEKKVATKAPVEDIEIINIDNNNVTVKEKEITNNDFSYIIKIADFYYKDTAKLLQNRLISDFYIKDSNISMISKTKFRLFMGPYSNIDNLKLAYSKIEKLDFENLEIIKK